VSWSQQQCSGPQQQRQPAHHARAHYACAHYQRYKRMIKQR
jgi:hypothetical protein